MHEWALAQSIIVTAQNVSKKEKLRKVNRVKIILGQLQQIDSGVFKGALEDITKDKRYSEFMKSADFEIEQEPASLKCRKCGSLWQAKDNINNLNYNESESVHFIPDLSHLYIRCPKCNSPDFEIITGRGVWIDSIEGE